jgi:hypothetical protein
MSIARTIALCATVAPVASPLWGAEDAYQARQELDRAYAQSLEQLAAWCDQQGLAEAARRTRQWLPADRDQRLLLFDPTQPAERASAGESSAMATWREKFRELREVQSEAMFGLAREAAAARQVSLAMELIGGTLRDNPDHEAARRALGYQRENDAWHTVFTRGKAKSNQVWHDRFGWLPKAHVARYEAGERFNKGRWITAEHDARLHAQIDTGWELETEHFLVTTNHSLEAAARFGLKLERLYAAWQQACAAYALTAGELFDRPARPIKRHQVLVFRNRDGFQQALRGEIPPDVAITGIYIAPRRTAYFYVPDRDPNQPGTVFDDTVLYHEAVHQLFAESRRGIVQPARDHNVWLVEGIACYFESLTERDGYLTVGGAQAQRFRAAQVRLLNDQFYVPLAELSAMGKDRLQRDPRIARLYSQSAGLTHFLMHSNQGRRRDGMLAVLTAIYTGRDRSTTLPEALGQDFDSLDAQYRQFMQANVSPPEER